MPENTRVEVALITMDLAGVNTCTSLVTRKELADKTIGTENAQSDGSMNA